MPLKMLKRLVTFLVAGIVSTAPAMAQQQAGQAPVATLTLDQAIERALSQGEEMRTAGAQLRDAQGQVREALSGALPQISGSVTYLRQFASVFQTFAGTGAGADSGLSDIFRNSPFGAPNNWNFSVTASQLLFSAGKVNAGLKAARSARSGANAQHQESAADVAFRVKRAYLQAQYRKRALEVAEAGLVEAREQLRQVQLFQRAGTRAEYDLLRAQVDAANQEPIVVQAQGDFDIALLELKRLVNIPAEQPVTLATPLTAEDGTIPTVATEGLALSTDRPALVAAEANLSMRQQLLRATKADRWPSVTVQSTFSEQSFPSSVFGFSSGFRHSWDAQLKVSVPLFNGFRTEAQVDRAEAAVEQALAQRNTVREQIEVDLAAAKAEVERTHSLLGARRVTIKQAQRAQHLASVRYANGMATQLEVSDARLLAQRAEINEAQSTLDYLVALAQLERALGAPLRTIRRPLERTAAPAGSNDVALTTPGQENRQ